MKHIAFALAAMALATAAHAQLVVNDAWVRATVPQQDGTGAFMQLKSAQNARLVSVQTPAAGVAEIHEMTLDHNVMKMRPLKDGLALPAGATVELKPGGYHVMLMSLKAPLKAGQTVPLTLVVEGQDGQRQSVEVNAAVRPLNAAAGHGGDPAPAHGTVKH